MNELISLVCQKAAIPEDSARKAVDTVQGFLKTKLPAGMGGQIESLIAGGGGGLGDTLKKATDGLGGLLGKE